MKLSAIDKKYSSLHHREVKFKKMMKLLLLAVVVAWHMYYTRNKAQLILMKWSIFRSLKFFCKDNPFKYLPARRQKCWRGSSTNLHKSWFMMWLGYRTGLTTTSSINEECNVQPAGIMTMPNINFCISTSLFRVARLWPILSNCDNGYSVNHDRSVWMKRNIPFTIA